MDPDTFRSVLGRFASGIVVVTARDSSGVDHAMTVSAFCSVSLDPPLVLLCVSHDATMHDLLMHEASLGVSVLAAHQEECSRRFADSGDETFDGLGYTRGEHGVVLLDEALAHLECRTEQRIAAGDHTIMVARVERTTVFDARPLLYYRGGYAQLER
jgi:flavin reductase (DIM6/NTAB) family NADH-FMN oxidoreductase RutF